LRKLARVCFQYVTSDPSKHDTSGRARGQVTIASTTVPNGVTASADMPTVTLGDTFEIPRERFRASGPGYSDNVKGRKMAVNRRNVDGGQLSVFGDPWSVSLESQPIVRIAEEARKKRESSPARLGACAAIIMIKQWRIRANNRDSGRFGRHFGACSLSDILTGL